MALDDMTAETVAHPDRALEVDGVLRPEKSQGRPPPRLGGDVRLERPGARATTVRQEPFTEIESPVASPSRTTEARNRCRPAPS